MKVWLASATCINALLSLAIICAAAAQQQQQQQIPQYVCKLLLQGRGNQSSPTPIASGTLQCTSPNDSDPIPIGINSTYMQQTAVQLAGVHVVHGSPCQLEAESTAGGGAIYALLYFCGELNITLYSLEVQGLQLQHDNLDWGTALVWFGQGVRATMQNVTISNSTASQIIHAADCVRVALSGSVVIGNTVRQGIIRAPSNAQLSISRSIFSHNTASSAQQMVSAAGFSLSGSSSLTIRSSRLEFGVVKSCIPGGVADGGAVDASDRSQVLIDNSTIHGGYASRMGGGVAFFSAGKLIIRSSNITNNSAPFGGGVFVQENAAVRVESSRIEGNRAVSDSDNSAAGDGGGLYVIHRANVTITNSSITSNTADGQGGAIWASNTAAVTLLSSSCLLNKAGLDGGCLFLAESSSMALESFSNVSGNEAAVGGGVSVVDKALLVLRGSSSIIRNTARTNGGGVSAADSSTLELLSGAVAGNTAAANGGGLFMAGDSLLSQLSNGVSISSNTAVWGGGVSYGSSQTFNVAVVDTAVSNNTAQFSADRLVAPTSLAIVGAASADGFVSRAGPNSSTLPVELNVTGKHGIPCEGLIVQALSNRSLILGVNRSDSQGRVAMNLPVRVPPGQTEITFSLLPSSGQEALISVAAVNFDLSVRSCQAGEVAPTPDTCQACLNGTYSLEPLNTTCDACPLGAQCPGGTTIEPLVGFWHSTPTSHQILRCPNVQACKGSRHKLQACRNDTACSSNISQSYGNAQCSEGYAGNLCGVCAATYGSAKAFTCRKCMGTGTLIGLYVLAAAVLLAFVKLLCHYTLAENHKLADALSGESSLGVPGGTLGGSTAPTGLLPRHSSGMSLAVLKLVFYLCMPVAMLGVLLIAEATVLRFLRSRRTRALNVQDRLASYAMVVAYFFTPAVLRIVCIPVDKPVSPPYTAAAVGLFWVHDTNQPCFQGYHTIWALGLGLPLLIVMCGIMPATIICKTAPNTHRLKDPDFTKHYGFLYRSYKPAYCWWEAVVLCQTAVLVAIGVFSYHLGAEKGLAMYIALAFIGVLLVTVKPYAHVQAGRVMVQGIGCLFLTTTGIMSMSETSESAAAGQTFDLVVAILLLILNLGFVLYVLYQLFRSVRWQHV